MADISFEIGDEVTGPTGQHYKLIEREPYERPRGLGWSEVLTWQSHCRKCGVEFTVKGGPTARGMTVHCPLHVLSRKERSRIALAASHSPAARSKRAATWKRKRELAKLF